MKNQTSSFPIRHAVLALMLVVFVGLAYLFVQPQDTVVDDRVVVAEEYSVRSELAASGESTQSLAQNGILVEAQAEIPESVESAEQIGQTQVVTELAERESSEQEQEQEPRKDIESPAVETPATVVEERTNPTPVQDAEVVAPPPSVASGFAAVPAVGFNSAQWLLGQEGSRYTLQLLTLSKATGVARFISAQPDPSEFAVFRMQRGDRKLYVITYGVFSTQGAAAQAAEQLSDRLDGVKPWIRALSLVQDTIRGTPQD